MVSFDGERFVLSTFEIIIFLGLAFSKSLVKYFCSISEIILRVNNCEQSSTVKDNFVLLKQSNKTHEETSTCSAIIMPNRLVLPT